MKKSDGLIALLAKQTTNCVGAMAVVYGKLFCAACSLCFLCFFANSADATLGSVESFVLINGNPKEQTKLMGSTLNCGSCHIAIRTSPASAASAPLGLSEVTQRFDLVALSTLSCWVFFWKWSTLVQESFSAFTVAILSAFAALVNVAVSHAWVFVEVIQRFINTATPARFADRIGLSHEMSLSQEGFLWLGPCGR